MNGNRYGKGCRGGVGLRVIVCAVSLLVLVGAIVALLKTFEARKADEYRRAEIISAYGIQEAFGKLSESFDWDAGFTNEPYPFEEEGGGTYSVAVARESRGDTLYVKIVSTGAVGSVKVTQTEERPIPQQMPGDSGGDSVLADEDKDIQ